MCPCHYARCIIFPHWPQDSVSELYPWFLILPIDFLKAGFLIESIIYYLTADDFHNDICSYNLCHKFHTHISNLLLNNRTWISNRYFKRIISRKELLSPLCLSSSSNHMYIEYSFNIQAKALWFLLLFLQI